MSKCKQCQIEVLDETQVCPLCRCVLEYDDDNENMYPEIVKKERKIKLALRIYVFAAIVCEVLLIYMNYRSFDGVWWCAIPGAGLLYIYLGMKSLLEYEYGYRSKAFSMIVLGLLYVILIDYVLGFERWSLNYVFPAVIIGLNAAIFVLMIVNLRNWQSYIMLEMLTIVLALFSIVMWKLHLITDPRVGELSLAIAAFSFLGTVIIGGGRAITELRRRFHIR